VIGGRLGLKLHGPASFLRTQVFTGSRDSKSMGNFTRFYFAGGGFMHLVTLFVLASAWYWASGLRSLRSGDQGRRRYGESALRLARNLRTLCLGAGMLGTLFGLLAALAGAHQAAASEAQQVLVGGIARALNPSIWAMVVVGVVSLAASLARHRAVRRELVG
jgi:hypothetical protein